MKTNVLNPIEILGAASVQKDFFSAPLADLRGPELSPLILKLYSWLKRISTLTWKTIRWTLEIIGKIGHALVTILFVAPPEQQAVDQARMKAIQLRGVF